VEKNQNKMVPPTGEKKRVPPPTKILVFATVAFFHARKRLREDKSL